jgi:hypothetical protein
MGAAMNNHPALVRLLLEAKVCVCVCERERERERERECVTVDIVLGLSCVCLYIIPAFCACLRRRACARESDRECDDVLTQQHTHIQPHTLQGGRSSAQRARRKSSRLSVHSSAL